MAEQSREAKEGAGEDVVRIEICMECGREYTFEGEPPPDDLTCEKCGGQVFRSFYDSAEHGEAQQDFIDSTARDTDSDDPEGDVTSGDLVDLERL